MKDRKEIEAARAWLRDAVLTRHPTWNRWEIDAAAQDFLTWRGGEVARVPDRGEAEAYLDDLFRRLEPAAAERRFSFLLMAAGVLWGAAKTAHLARVLRDRRCSPKPARKTAWERAETTIARLPAEWQEPLRAHLVRSRDTPRGRGSATVWSAAHLEAVAHAVNYWHAFCAETGCDPRPTGTSFEAFARARTAQGVSEATAADYLDRIHSAFTIVLEPRFRSDACEYVLADWRQRGHAAGTPTKRTADIVPASEVYELGFGLMAAARARPFYGVHAAGEFRNGLLLSVAAATPQRARALAAFDFASTCRLLEAPLIAIRLPGSALKGPERRKHTRSFSATLENDRLWNALDEYRRVFRPIFDDGTCLFPSALSPGAAISEDRIGILTAQLLKEHLGVSGSIHRIRDYVATEASEELLHGGRLAPVLLGHRSAATTARHYDHSEGIAATRAWSTRIEARQQGRPRLLA